tara:strand:+ start:1971 stop:2255 length:285 start_codon:yes stop_codon:yes gene_type:complete
METTKGIYIMRMGDYNNEIRVLDILTFLSKIDGDQDVEVVGKLYTTKNAIEVLLDGEWWFASQSLPRVIKAKRQEYNTQKRNLQYYINELKEQF